MSEKFLHYGLQSIDSEDISAVSKALSDEWITRGPITEKFEQTLADYCGSRYAVAFNSGTSALVAAAYASDITPHDRLFTTANTFVGTLAGTCQLGVLPIFIDVDPNNGNMDIDLLRENLNQPSSRGRDVIIPVHFAGIPVDMAKLDKMIRKDNTVVIEDAAHALGSCYSDGQKVGCCAWSQMTVFSFHPSKLITTGEGGLVTTNDEKLYQRLKRIRHNGIDRETLKLEEIPFPGFYQVEEITGNYHLTDFQAALGLSQSHRMERFIAKRYRLMQLYSDLLKNTPYLKHVFVPQDLNIAYHLCVVLIDFKAVKKSRGEVMEFLKKEGIGTQVHYIPLYRHPYFVAKCGDLIDYLPQSEAYYQKTLSLPLHVNMEESDVERVVKTLKQVLFG